jgi:hypothetical protein
MRLAKIVCGLLLIVAAAWLVVPAAREAWSLVSLAADSPKQPAMEFAIGKFSLRGWSFVLMSGMVGIVLVSFGFHVLLSQNAES